MKILLIEDEANVASFVKRGLNEAGYNVTVAFDGTSGYKMATEYDFGLIILDIMLPGMNGIEVCRKLRQDGIDTAIIMLTALGSTENIVTGLDSGADDYLAKPFKFAELLARVRTWMRRQGVANQNGRDNTLSLADLTLNTAEKLATRSGKQITLTATEYRLLEYLLKNQRRVVSRVEILENVWDIDFNMSTNVVDVYVNYLRKKIDKGFEPKLIHTIVGMGYVMKEDTYNEDPN
ncbi:MAG: response regulator transcription factor [Flavipsychrobacter sp.]|nr:response regulator transcription factor [Flavipsychrobacter sp.]